MLRNFRRLRGVIAASAVAGALLVLPGAANAAADIQLDVTHADAVQTSGELTTFTVVLTNTTPANPTTDQGTVTLSSNTGTIAVEGTPVVAGDAGDVAKITCTAGSAVCTVATGFIGDTVVDETITFSVRLPRARVTNYTVTADGTDAGSGEWGNSDTSTGFIVSKGGPSRIAGSFSALTPAAGVAGVADQWVIQNGTVTSTATITNKGSGEADFVTFRFSANGSQNEFSPIPPNPAFSPVVTVLPNPACAPTATPGECTFDSLAAGASITVPVSMSGLTHFGSATIFGSVNAKADSSFDDGLDSRSIEITDGSTYETHVNVDAAADAAAGNADVAFAIELINNGPATVTNGLLFVDAISFLPSGASTFDPTNATSIQSIQKITLSNGAACVNRMSGVTVLKDRFQCTIASLPVGQRLTGQVVARFATAKADEDGFISADLRTPGFDSFASTDGGDSIALNPTRTVDLQMSVSSAAMVGAERVLSETVTITNKGNAAADRVTLNGELRGVGGKYDAATLPGTCTGVNKPQFSTCFLGSIPAGGTASITLPIMTGTTLGTLTSIYRVSSSSLPSFATPPLPSAVELNFDDNTAAHSVEVVKASTVLLEGVKTTKTPAMAAAAVNKTGVKTVVTSPVDANATVVLQLPFSTAVKFGLVKLVKKKTGKKVVKNPSIITVGTSTTKLVGGKATTITTKYSLKYKKALAKVKVAYTLKRVLTVNSTAPANKDASFAQTTSVVVKAAKKGKK